MSLPCKCIVFESDFLLISLVFLVEISNSCVSGVATENIYLISFLAFPYYVMSCIFIIQIFFSHIAMEYLE